MMVAVHKHGKTLYNNDLPRNAARMLSPGSVAAVQTA